MESYLQNLEWLWIVVMILAVIVEISTTVLVSVWFAAGAFIAMLAAFLGASPTAQVLLFLLVSILALVVARPLARRYVDPHIVPTNADRLLGTEGKVTETIDNENASGAVYADGKTWTARSADGEVIPAGETVEIVSMESIKLIVRPKAAAASK